MTDAPDPKYLEMFPAWLRSLGEDAGALGAIVSGDGSEQVKRSVIAGLNYIFKSLDLIPDGIDDLGFMDDAFVLRVAASLACDADGAAKTGVLERLATDAGEVRAFLGADYTRLETYVKGLHKGAARGRTVDDIIEDESQRKEFVHEVAAWAKDYQAPSFTRDPKTLLKLKSFLNAKLP
ncbi:MAG TPA: YkvA family protein [Polyangiaceae bacterium]|jgi:uncharacterized membrane protein YkvA (DUF1232 family)